MELQIIGWVIAGTICTVIVIALVLSRMMFPREFLDDPPTAQSQTRPEDDPPPDGVQDLKEYRRGHWK